jgi:hypothetical protein
VGGAWRFVLNPVTGIGSSQDSASPSATFANVEAGDYTASVQRLDAAGNAIGDAASVAFTVDSTAVMIDVPDVLTVEVTP